MGGTGERESKQVNYYIIGAYDEYGELMARMFAKYNEIQSNNDLIIKKYLIKNIKISDKNQINVNWEINILKNISENNQKKVREFLKLKSPKDKNAEMNAEKKLYNNVLIKFGSDNLERLIKLLNHQTCLNMPQFAIITDKNIGFQLTHSRYLQIIIGSTENLEDLQEKLFSYMIERDGYYNERWDKCLVMSPNLILTTKNISNAKLNILLIGISRCGKSTFINLFCNKMISLESPENESVTKNITEYPYYIKGSDNNLIQINLTDTPGLIKTEKLNSIDSVKDLIDKKFKQCEDSKDDIHIIYFFSEPNSNLENNKNFFKYLIEINEKRLQKNKKKIPIIFIINHCRDAKTSSQAFETFLKNNHLSKLIENIEAENKGENIDNSIDSDNSDNKEIELKNNIIGVNLLSTINKACDFKAYGFDKIMKATNYFLKRNNPLKKEYFDFLSEKLPIIENYNLAFKNNTLDEKGKINFLKIKKEIKNIMVKISEENVFMENCKDESDYIAEARFKSNWITLTSCCIGFGAGFIPIPFADMGLLLPLSFIMIKQIANTYGIYLEEIPKFDIFKLVLGLGANVASEAGGQIAEKSIESLGKQGGKKVMENFTEQALKYNVVLVNGPGNMEKIIQNIATPVVKESSDNILYKGIQFLWNNSKKFQETAGKEILSGAENFATNYANKLISNPDSVKVATEVVTDLAKQRGATLQNNCIQFLSGGATKFGGNTFIHALPVISGFFDAYTTYSNGKSAINYFEEYIRKTMAIGPILKRKKDYDSIFTFIESHS